MYKVMCVNIYKLVKQALMSGANAACSNLNALTMAQQCIERYSREFLCMHTMDRESQNERKSLLA